MEWVAYLYTPVLSFDSNDISMRYSLEEALMQKEPNNIVSQVLVQFIINLKPQTRNLR